MVSRVVGTVELADDIALAAKLAAYSLLFLAVCDTARMPRFRTCTESGQGQPCLGAGKGSCQNSNNDTHKHLLMFKLRIPEVKSEPYFCNYFCFVIYIYVTIELFLIMFGYLNNSIFVATVVYTARTFHRKVNVSSLQSGSVSV